MMLNYPVMARLASLDFPTHSKKEELQHPKQKAPKQNHFQVIIMKTFLPYSVNRDA